MRALSSIVDCDPDLLAPPRVGADVGPGCRIAELDDRMPLTHDVPGQTNRGESEHDVRVSVHGAIEYPHGFSCFFCGNSRAFTVSVRSVPEYQQPRYLSLG
jgi:hypothetical protein